MSSIAGGSGAKNFITNAGTAIAVNSTISVVGSGGIVTSASGNTVTISGSGVDVLAYTNVNTSPYVVLSSDEYISVDCSGGAITLRFPSVAASGRVWVVKDRTGSAASNNITITTVSGAVNIDGSTTFVMNSAYESIQIIGNGSTYEIY